MLLKKSLVARLILVLASFCFSNYAHSTATHDAHDIYGKTYHFSMNSGKWVIINYWASWCQFCINEIPELNQFAEAIKNRPVIFFGVNYDEASDEDQQAFASQHGINYLLLHNNPFADLVANNPISTLPTTFIISPAGHVQVLHGQIHLSEMLDKIS